MDELAIVGATRCHQGAPHRGSTTHRGCERTDAFRPTAEASAPGARPEQDNQPAPGAELI
jgi:hypothetical protein